MIRYKKGNILPMSEESLISSKSKKILREEKQTFKAINAKIRREKIFNQLHPWKAIFIMVAPTVISQFVMATYQIVDKLIASKFGSNYILANYDNLSFEQTKEIINIATNYAGVVISILFAFTLLVSIGTSIKVSIGYGKNDPKEIANNIGTGLILSISLAISLTIIMWFLAGSIIDFQAGSNINVTDSYIKEVIYKEALRYSRILIVGILFLFSANFWIMLLRSEGRVIAIVWINLIVCIMNIALDFLFILVFKMGMAGTAIATVIAWVAYLVSPLIIIYNSKSYLRISFSSLRFKWALAVGILILGLATLFENIAQATLSMVTSRILNELPAPDYPTAGAPVYIQINSAITPWLFLINAPIIGIGYGARALVGYAYGSKNYRRIWDFIWRLFALLIGILTLLTIMVFSLGNYMLMAFNVNFNMANYFTIYIILQFMFYPLAAFSYIAIILYQSINRAGLALFTSLQRTTIMPLLSLIIGFIVARKLSDGFYYYLFIGLIDLLASLVLIPMLSYTFIKNRDYIFNKNVIK